jgi:UDP-N-acetylmuramate dehydrogenase
VDPATGEVRTLAGAEVRWDYRTSHLGGRIVASADLALETGEPEVLRRQAREWLRRKAAAQPLSAPSAGCVFKNPPAGSAGSLIDRAGLKGAREGAAVVSDRHANFILNEGGRASARDILTLLERVRGRVEAAFGVRLETELVIARDSGTGIPGEPDVDGKAGNSVVDGSSRADCG